MKGGPGDVQMHVGLLIGRKKTNKKRTLFEDLRNTKSFLFVRLSERKLTAGYFPISHSKL